MLAILGLGTHLDFGLLFTNALGLWLLTSCYSVLGLYLSSLTKQPIVAAMNAIALLFGLWLIDVGSSENGSSMRTLSPSSHAQSFNSGFIFSEDLVYFALFITLFLMLTIRRVNNNRLYA